MPRESDSRQAWEVAEKYKVSNCFYTHLVSGDIRGTVQS